MPRISFTLFLTFMAILYFILDVLFNIMYGEFYP